MSALPDDEQDAVASIILEEIEDEERWRATFAKFAGRACASCRTRAPEIARGDVLPFDPVTKPE